MIFCLLFVTDVIDVDKDAKNPRSNRMEHEHDRADQADDEGFLDFVAFVWSKHLIE
jgi:hypothetical protein